MLGTVVDGAMWDAAYDLHATTEDGRPSASVNLHFRARVSQTTGEDWTGTTLTLSTAAFDALGQGLPAFKPLRVAPMAQGFVSYGGNGNLRQVYGAGASGAPTSIPFPYNPRGRVPQLPTQSMLDGGPASSFPVQQMQQMQQQQQQQQQPQIATAGRMHASRTAEAAAASASPYVSPPNEGSTAEPTPEDSFDEAISVSEFTDLNLEEGGGSKARTVVSESPFSRTYRVDGKSSIPSDGRDHQVLIAVLPFDAKLSYVALPRVQTVAYMQVGTSTVRGPATYADVHPV
jgi:hypothetical protein